MRRLPPTRVLLALALLGPTVSARAGEEKPAAVSPGEVRLHFTRPADWRCVDRDHCTRCRNVSDHASRVIVRRVAAAETEHVDIEASDGLEVCAR